MSRSRCKLWLTVTCAPCRYSLRHRSDKHEVRQFLVRPMLCSSVFPALHSVEGCSSVTVTLDMLTLRPIVFPLCEDLRLPLSSDRRLASSDRHDPRDRFQGPLPSVDCLCPFFSLYLWKLTVHLLPEAASTSVADADASFISSLSAHHLLQRTRRLGDGYPEGERWS
jgi:hypothetical protein